MRTVTSTKDVEVTITQPRKEKQPLKLEFFFVLKGDSKRYVKQAGVLDLAFRNLLGHKVRALAGVKPSSLHKS